MPNFQISQIPKFPNSKIPKFQNSQFPKLQNSKIPKLQNSKIPKFLAPWNFADFLGIIAPVGIFENSDPSRRFPGSLEFGGSGIFAEF